jgi:hypothetical protein
MLVLSPMEATVEYHHSTEAHAKRLVEKGAAELNQTQLQHQLSQMAEMVELVLEHWQEEVHLVAQLGLQLQRDRELLGWLEEMVRGMVRSASEEVEAPGE